MPTPPSFLLLGLLLLSCAPLPGEPAAEAEVVTPRPPTYDRIDLPQATVHVVHVPDPVAYPVRVAVTADLMRLGEMVADTCDQTDCAVAAVNAGFFDPNNGLTTSHSIVDGELVADPTENQRLVGNPNLAPYMEQILNRSEFRRYACEHGPQYAIALHQAPVPSGCTLVDAIGAGPQLLPEDTSMAEAFVDPGASPPRDALGSQAANARSAVGLTAEGGVILVMVAQVPEESPSGFTFADLATFMAERGIVQALNLDGGSSSTLMFGGEIHYGRLDPAGEPIQRPIKSILWIDGGRDF